MLKLEDFAKTPNPIAKHYTTFRVADRLLLTGHSHQAWPDVAFKGQVEAWTVAAEHVDDKWSHALAKADRVRRGFGDLLGADAGEIALGPNTHELLIRFLSALPLAARPRLVTTDGEFHTIRRQLDRLAEERWIEVVKVSAKSASTISERLSATVDERTAAVLVSSVLYENAHIVPDLGELLDACHRVGAELLVDTYHHLNALPFALETMRLREAFIVGGGYKYCQLGEGNCFLRVPPGREHMRPIVTGWFSEFARLSEQSGSEVPYGEGPSRWAGSTYDPTSHYRAAHVFDFFESEGLRPELLRQVSQRQIGLMIERFDALDLDPRKIDRDRTVEVDELGAFLALTTDRASKISQALRRRGVMTDARGDQLRFGPAPYLSDDQLMAAIDGLGEVMRPG